MVFSFFLTPGLRVNSGEVPVRIGVVRLLLQYTFKGSRCQFYVALFSKNTGQAGTGLQMIFIKFDDRIVSFSRRSQITCTV